jgi:hypothetical protein
MSMINKIDVDRDDTQMLKATRHVEGSLVYTA